MLRRPHSEKHRVSLWGWSEVSLWSQLRGWKQNSLVALPARDRLTLKVQVPPRPRTRGPHPAHSRDRPEAERPVKVTHEPQAGLGPAPGSLLHPSILKRLPLLLRFKAAMFLPKSFPPAASSPSPTSGRECMITDRHLDGCICPSKVQWPAWAESDKTSLGLLCVLWSLTPPHPPQKNVFSCGSGARSHKSSCLQGHAPSQGSSGGSSSSWRLGAPWPVATSPIPALVVTRPLLGVCSFSSAS